MAKSLGQAHGTGHSPTGAFGHGGHHRKEMKQMASQTAPDHMIQDPSNGLPPSPMGSMGGAEPGMQ